MKKILFTIAIILTLGFNANAQRTDAIVNDWGMGSNNEWRDAIAIALTLPAGDLGGINGDIDAPLGSGLLVLTALGAGYAFTRKKK